MPNSAYWDSCVFIDFFQKTAGRIDAIEYLLSEARHGTFRLVTSALSIVEVNKIGGAVPLREEESKTIIEFFENPYIVIRQLARIIHMRWN
jgi:hypothetical protein